MQRSWEKRIALRMKEGRAYDKNELLASVGKPFSSVRDLFMNPLIEIVKPSNVPRVVVSCLVAIAAEQKSLISCLLFYYDGKTLISNLFL